jgi:uncharacterized HAD superfamily protein
MTELSHPLVILRPVLLALDLDGVLCDIGPSVAARLSARFGVATHPSAWRSYDLRLLELGLPQAPFHSFLDETFADPALYAQAPVVPGAAAGVAALRSVGWRLVAVTARAPHLAEATTEWLARHRLPVESVHHTPVGTKAAAAARLGVVASVEDNPAEAELLAAVCQSWLLDRPYNREYPLQQCRRLSSWDDAVGRLCQLRLFA